MYVKVKVEHAGLSYISSIFIYASKIYVRTHLKTLRQSKSTLTVACFFCDCCLLKFSNFLLFQLDSIIAEKLGYLPELLPETVPSVFCLRPFLEALLKSLVLNRNVLVLA